MVNTHTHGNTGVVRLWGWSSPMATVTATVTATVRASARTATVAAVTAATASTPLAAAAAPIACSAVANASGVWRLLLPPVSAPSAAPPAAAYTAYAITLTSSADSTPKTITLQDVLFGEVWVISGQSNAAFTMGTTPSPPLLLPSSMHPPTARLLEPALSLRGMQLC